MNRKFIITNSISQKNTFFLVLHPSIKSFSQTIDDINILSTKKYDGTIKTDLVLMTGDREGRYIEGKIKDGKIDKASFILAKEDPELTQLIEETYTSLPEGDMNKIYPISYRNRLKKLKSYYEN